MSKPSEEFEQAYDNFLAGCDVDTTMLDCAEFMFNAGRESMGQGEPVKQCRGYALLGTGNYLLNHSDDFHPELGVELIITLATAKDKEGNRQIGETRDNPHHRQPIQPEDMVVRIGFLNERGLFALEKQLAEIRKQFFADRPAQPVQPAACQYCNGTGDVHGIDGEWHGECTECKTAPAVAINEPDPSECFNAAISYALKCGNGDGGLEFLACWREGNFGAIRKEWPDAPDAVFKGAEVVKGARYE